MKRIIPLLVLLAILALPHMAAAQGYSVDSSSYNWMAERDYSEYRIADDDPSTAWAEGGRGAGEGEWVSFSFEAPINLARLGIRNGDQRQGDWESCNRVRELRVQYDGGREKVVELRNQTGLQYVDIKDEVSELKLTIVSIHPAENMWNQSVTCISDVTFEVYATTEEIVAAASGNEAEEVQEIPDEKAESEAEASAETAEVKKSPPLKAPAKKASEAQAKPAKEGKVKQEEIQAEAKPEKSLEVAKPSMEKEKEQGGVATEKADKPRSENVMSDPRAEAVSIVREYYKRLNTLDETFPDLMAARVYEQELLSFYYFEEIQKQLGTAEKLREAEVDLSGLDIQVEKITDVTASVTSKGAYVIGTPGQKLMVDENARFDLVLEQEVWKIEKKTDE